MKKFKKYSFLGIAMLLVIGIAVGSFLFNTRNSFPQNRGRNHKQWNV